MADPLESEFALAEKRGAERLREPRALSARYDGGRDRIIVTLTTGIEVGFAPRNAQGLEHASADQLREIEVTPFGLGLHFPKLDADIYVPGLLDGLLGSEAWLRRRAATALATASLPPPPSAPPRSRRPRP